MGYTRNARLNGGVRFSLTSRGSACYGRSMSAYKLRFHLPSPKDRQDTLARVDIVFTPEAGALYGMRFSGIIVKESAHRYAPSQPYIYYPSRFVGGRLLRPYLEAELNEQGASSDRLTQTILATYAEWRGDQKAVVPVESA